MQFKSFTRTAVVGACALLAGSIALPASAQVGEFRVLPYQLNPALDGIQLTWFTIIRVLGYLRVCEQTCMTANRWKVHNYAI